MTTETLIRVDGEAPANIATKREQRETGTFSIIGNSGIRTSFPNPTQRRAVRKPKAAGKTVRVGWTVEKIRRARTTMQLLDLKPLIKQVKENSEVHLAYMVLSCAKGMKLTPEDWQAMAKQFIQQARKIVGEEFTYVWSTGFKRNEQPHLDFLSALTKSEARELQKVWSRIAGWGDHGSLNDAAFVSMSTRYQDQVKCEEALARQALNYFVLNGESEAAVAKRHQYKTPKSPAWREAAGQIRMWGRSKNLVEAEAVTFEITNRRQRREVDGYLREALGIQPKMVRWLYHHGEVSEAFDVSPFSHDRHSGTTHVVPITQKMLRDIQALIDKYAS